MLSILKERQLPSLICPSDPSILGSVTAQRTRHRETFLELKIMRTAVILDFKDHQMALTVILGSAGANILKSSSDFLSQGITHVQLTLTLVQVRKSNCLDLRENINKS